MRIYIPTHRRLDKQITYHGLPEYWKEKTVLVVDAQDAAQVSYHMDLQSAHILVVPEEVKTIAAKRAWIINQATEDRIVMLDDDLRFFSKRDDDPTKLVKSTPIEIDAKLVELDSRLVQHVHAGFSARQGNNHLPRGWKTPHRMMYVLGYRPAVLRAECELGRIENREDFDLTLQLLRKGFPNAVSADICVDQTYNADGGVKDQRTVESSNADADKLAALHPGFVKVKEKAYTGSVPRKEVIVQWAKALKAGLDARA